MARPRSIARHRLCRVFWLYIYLERFASTIYSLPLHFCVTFFDPIWVSLLLALGQLAQRCFCYNKRPRPAVERGVLVRVTRISGTNSPARWFSKTWDKTRPGVRHLTRVFVARGVLCQGRVGEPQSCWQPDSFGQGWICSVDCKLIASETTDTI